MQTHFARNVYTYNFVVSSAECIVYVHISFITYNSER
jgi:hypothetical protein